MATIEHKKCKKPFTSLNETYRPGDDVLILPALGTDERYAVIADCGYHYVSKDYFYDDETDIGECTSASTISTDNVVTDEDYEVVTDRGWTDVNEEAKWEQRRYEIARDYLVHNPSMTTEECVFVADNLIDKLRK